MARAPRPSASGPGDRELLQAVFHTLGEQGILVTDASHLVVMANAGAYRLFGYPPEELSGRCLTALVELPDGADTDLLFDARYAADNRFHLLRHADGTHRRAALSTGAVRDPYGRFTGGIVVAWQPGDNRVADALGEVERQQAEFAATVSHELRTPLASVVGNTEMLLDGDAGPLTGPARGLVEAVDRNARRLQSLVADLLVVCRMEANPLRENARPVVAQAVLERAVRALASVPAGRDVHLDLRQPARAVLVHADPEQLRRLVGAVLDNAVRFTPPGGTVRIRLRTVDGYVRLRVVDTGVRPAALDPMLGLDTDPGTRELPGAGLGLAVARAIAEAMAGTLRTGTTSTGGTVVEVDLPPAVRTGEPRLAHPSVAP